MLPTFVIGLREGLEAALIVGIVAAFLRQRGRRDALRWVWLGVSAAVAICVATGVVLTVISANLPQRQQEGLETVVGAVAVAMVTYMVVWMRRHARDLKGQLEQVAGGALAAGSAWALVAMAFLAVLREGLETAVFLLAAFNASGDVAMSGGGALLGIVCAVALGWGIYRGGVRINLSRFFRLTGLVLVLVAAGLVVTALHTANEAGWLTVGQGRTVDLSWLVAPGSPQSSVLTGVLGFQQHPTVIELIGWLVYLVPVAFYVARPPGWSPRRDMVRAASLGVGLAALLAAGWLALLAPAAPDRLTAGQQSSVALSGEVVTNGVAAVTSTSRPLAGEVTLKVLARSGDTAVVDYTMRTAPTDATSAGSPVPVSSVRRTWSLRAATLGAAAPPADAPAGTTPVPGLVFAFPAGASAERYRVELPAAERLVTAVAAGYEVRAGLRTRHYHYELDAGPVTDPTVLAGLPRTLTQDQLLAAGGGRLPIGVTAAQLAQPAPVTYHETLRGDLWVEPTSGTIVSWTRTELRTATLGDAMGGAVLGPVERRSLAPTAASVVAATRTAQADAAAMRSHHRLAVVLPLALTGGGVAALALGVVLWATRRRSAGPATAESLASATKIRLG